MLDEVSPNWDPKMRVLGTETALGGGWGGFKSHTSICGGRGVSNSPSGKIRKMATQHWTVHKMQSFGASSSALHPALPAPRSPSRRRSAELRVTVRCPPRCRRGSAAATSDFPASITFLMNCCDCRNVNCAGWIVLAFSEHLNVCVCVWNTS